MLLCLRKTEVLAATAPFRYLWGKYVNGAQFRETEGENNIPAARAVLHKVCRLIPQFSSATSVTPYFSLMQACYYVSMSCLNIQICSFITCPCCTDVTLHNNLSCNTCNTCDITPPWKWFAHPSVACRSKESSCHRSKLSDLVDAA